jgi:hypothetical protein
MSHSFTCCFLVQILEIGISPCHQTRVIPQIIFFITRCDNPHRTIHSAWLIRLNLKVSVIREMNLRESTYRLVWAEPKTIATSTILYLIKFVSYHFTLEPPCFYSTNRKLLWMLGSKIWPQTIHFPSRTLASLLAIVFGHPHQEIHFIFSSTVQVL